MIPMMPMPRKAGEQEEAQCHDMVAFRWTAHSYCSDVAFVHTRKPERLASKFITAIIVNRFVQYVWEVHCFRNAAVTSQGTRL